MSRLEKGTARKKLLLIITGVLLLAIAGAIVYAICSNGHDTNGTCTENTYNSGLMDKPILYLYPEKETDVTVYLENFQALTCSYPLYQSTGWRVRATPGGDLLDLETGRTLYALYYESGTVTDFETEAEGFVVRGTDAAAFLEEKLSVLGLTDREAEEFIIYWLPVLQQNEYNYIRFASVEEMNANMPLRVEPAPDTVIRVLMTYKGLQEPIEVNGQELATPERVGFTVVEWGGTEIH